MEARTSDTQNNITAALGRAAHCVCLRSNMTGMPMESLPSGRLESEGKGDISHGPSAGSCLDSTWSPDTWYLSEITAVLL